MRFTSGKYTTNCQFCGVAVERMTLNRSKATCFDCKTARNKEYSRNHGRDNVRYDDVATWHKKNKKT